MASAPKRRARRKRAQNALGDPATLRDICDHVIGGGTLVEWCRARDVRYQDIALWLAAEDHRREKFDAALELRGEFLSELVVRNLRMFADLDWGRAYDEHGNLLHVPDMPEDLRRALQGFEVTEEYTGRGEAREKIGYTKKIRLVSPERAVELLGKYRKMFVDKIEHSADMTLEQLLSKSREPAAST